MAKICENIICIIHIIWLRISIQKRTLVKSQLQHRNRKVVLKQDKWIQYQNLRSLRDRWNWSNAHHVSVRKLIGEYSELDMVTNPPAGWDLQRRRTEILKCLNMSKWCYEILWIHHESIMIVLFKEIQAKIDTYITSFDTSCTGHCTGRCRKAWLASMHGVQEAKVLQPRCQIPWHCLASHRHLATRCEPTSLRRSEPQASHF